MYVNYEQQEGIVEVEKEDSDEFSQGFEFIQVTDKIKGDHRQIPISFNWRSSNIRDLGRAYFL